MAFAVERLESSWGSISVETEEQSRGSTAVCKEGFGLKAAIQSFLEEIKASQEEEEMTEKGVAQTHRVVMSIMARMWDCQLDWV